MPRVSVKVIGEKEVQQALRDVPGTVDEGLFDGLNAIGLMVSGLARRLVQRGPASGRIYKSGTVSHRASAPGEAPATDTGRLVASIIYKVAKFARKVFIIAGTRYAKWLEYGTRTMAARPFLRRALTELKDKFPGILKRYILARIRQKFSGA